VAKLKNAGDWVVASAVVLSSVLLLGALVVALNGSLFHGARRTVVVDFSDVTGIDVNSKVKFAGAEAGVVSAIRVLSAEERMASSNPGLAVRLTLAMQDDLPDIPVDSIASLAADTILSDKFVLISAGTASAEPLANGGKIGSIPPTTFDQLIRNADQALLALNTIVGAIEGDSGDLVAGITVLIAEAAEAVGDAKTVLDEVSKIVVAGKPLLEGLNGTVGEAQGLISDARDPLMNSLRALEAATRQMESAAAAGEKLLTDNAAAVESTTTNLNRAVEDLKVTVANAKVATTYAKILARRLTQRPSQLIWGPASVPPLPSEREILRSTKPLPDGLEAAD